MIPKKNSLIHVVEEWECGKKVAKNTRNLRVEGMKDK